MLPNCGKRVAFGAGGLVLVGDGGGGLVAGGGNEVCARHDKT